MDERVERVRALLRAGRLEEACAGLQGQDFVDPATDLGARSLGRVESLELFRLPVELGGGALVAVGGRYRSLHPVYPGDTFRVELGCGLGTGVGASAVSVFLLSGGRRRDLAYWNVDVSSDQDADEVLGAAVEALLERFGQELGTRLEPSRRLRES